jgi:hypothetical protein
MPNTQSKSTLIAASRNFQSVTSWVQADQICLVAANGASSTMRPGHKTKIRCAGNNLAHCTSLDLHLLLLQQASPVAMVVLETRTKRSPGEHRTRIW